MKVTLSSLAGFCFGVRRSVDILYKEMEKGGRPIYTLGKLIHNEDFNKELEEKNVLPIDIGDIRSLPENSVVIIRTHGVGPGVYAELEKYGIDYIDATCPYVKKIHNIVLNEKKIPGTHFIVIGDIKHPEVEGIVSYADEGSYTVCSGLDELKEFSVKCNKNERYVLLSQTTQNIGEWKKCLSFAENLYTNPRIFDTICNVTENRQKDADTISKDSDLMIVIGGPHSSNTRKLTEISSRNCDTLQIENAKDPALSKIPRNIKNVGITAGASTPDRIIEEVFKTMAENNNVEETLSFEEMLNESFKTLNTGEEATGTIIGISPNEIQIDLGIKHTGILSFDELTDDSSFVIDDHYKVGDKINVLLMKFSDADGTVQVSKKKLENRLGWSEICAAFEQGTVIESKVDRDVNGGVLTAYKGQTVFIPGRLSGVAVNTPLSELVGKSVKYKIIDVDQQRKRAVGSVKAYLSEQQKAVEDKFWSEIEEGKQYDGVVKSLTNYGAFVDLGGVDGMVHITELSWKHIKHPGDVVKVGDNIHVFVKSFNPETRKISLGYKTEETNPWTLLAGKYNVGDVASVKIVNITSFGAFAEVIPGIDGLIHISQLANKRVNTPADVVKVGDVVDAKITEIDYDAKKVSLSMRALLADEELPEENTSEDNASEESDAE